jgi:hypothetical protein
LRGKVAALVFIELRDELQDLNHAGGGHTERMAPLSASVEPSPPDLNQVVRCPSNRFVLS